MRRRTAVEVEQEVEALRSMDAKTLRGRWRDILKTEPPAKMQSGFLRLAIAYRLQEMAHGGLNPEALRRLRKYSKAFEQQRDAIEMSGPSKVPFRAPVSLSPGTRLMREWNGTTHLVEVVENGFVWRGARYKTLSATAVAITGTKWSGPKFFGLLPAQAEKRPRTSDGRAGAEAREKAA